MTAKKGVASRNPEKALSRPSTRPSRKVTAGADAQQRILEAVDELFYREGARAVGVDAVVKRAGVNKMSLYRQFESKDALLQEYLARRDERFWAYFDASMAKHPADPKQQLLQFFIDLAERAGKASYRGCPFVNVAVEFPDREHPARQAVTANKAALWKRLHTLSVACGAEDPKLLANGMAVLIEGAYTASQTYNPAQPLLKTLPQIARSLIDAACP
jgi:AcrR family transcriptional regulator